MHIKTLMVLIATIGFIFIFILYYNFQRGYKISEKYIPLTHGVMEIKYEVSNAYLWLDKLKVGDDSKNIEHVLASIEKSINYTTTMLNGCIKEERTYFTLNNNGINLRNLIKEIQIDLNEINIQSLQEYENSIDLHLSEKRDKEFDLLFESIIHKCKDAEILLKKIVKNELKAFSIMDKLLILNSIIFLIIILIFTYKNKIKNLLFIHDLEKKNYDLLTAQKIAKIGMWSLNIKKNHLIWDNETYKIFDFANNKSIVTVDDFYNSIHLDDIKMVSDVYNKHLKDKTPYQITYRLKTKLNIVKYIEERCETIFDVNGLPIKSYGTMQDVTTIKEQELTLKNQEILLFHQSRLAQLGEMISMIAHQWRQPLSTISSTTIDIQISLDLESYDLDTKKGREDFLEYLLISLQTINSLVQNLTLTLDDFRNFYKPTKALVEMTLESVITKCVEIIISSLKHDNIEIIYQYNSSEIIKMYDHKVMQVILNILKNAQDNFNENNVENPTITISTNSRSISICDNGGGIDENIIDKIFDPYFSTKDEKNGSGIGLYMSKLIIEDHHNGNLQVTNKDDGSCFKIEIGELE